MVAFSLLFACAPEAAKPSAASCSLTARATATPVAGDANADGHVDIADGAYVHDHLFRRGPAPACPAATDVVPQGTIEAGDGFAIWLHLFAGNTRLPEIADGDCTAPESPAEATCGDGLKLAIDAPPSVTGTTFDASVTLTTGALTVRAWSLGVKAEGCTITAATTLGTSAADLRDDPPGLRDGGFDRRDLTADGGVVSALVMDLAADAALPPSGTAVSVLALTVEAPAGSGCSTCTLTVTDGLAGEGEPVDVIVASEGRAYAPATSAASVEVCSG